MDKYFHFKNFKIKYTTLFLFVFLIVAFYYNYNKIVFMRPMGIHQWRNCICANYALNYYYGADFLRPETGSFHADNHTSDVVVLEFPIFYYLVSLLYRIFGYQEFLYRLANVIVGFLGLLALFKLSRRILNDHFFAFVIPILIFTSPVFVFYLNNFIIDPTSLSLSFIGLYFFYQFYYERKSKYFFFAMLMLLLGGLMKPPSLLVFFAILTVFGLELMFGMRFNEGEKLFKRPLIYIVGFISVIAGIVVWFYYSKKFGESHGVIEPVSTRSLWSITRTEAQPIWNGFKVCFKRGYFHSPIFIYLTAAILLYNIVFIRKYNRLLNFFTFLILAQGIAFSLLFYASIGRCDYYQINNLMFIAVLYLNFAYYFKNNFPRPFKNKISRLVVFVGVLLLIHDCKLGIKNRYSDWFYHYSDSYYVQKYGNITPYLRTLGIKREDRVYCPYDMSMNISLYLMDQKGNTDGQLGGSISSRIDYLKSKGTKYLIIGDKSFYQQDIGPYIQNKIGHFNGVDIYKLD